MLVRLGIVGIVLLVTLGYARDSPDYFELGDYSGDIAFADQLASRVRREKDDAKWLPTFPSDYVLDNENKKETTEHTYYNRTTMVVDSAKLEKYYINVSDWITHPDVVGQTKHDHLYEAYRKAAGVKLKFEFPFYGHKLNNITIATGGFCYVGDQTHSWLAATQYIAPLMANFDTISNDSNIMFGDDGSKFVVEWQNVKLRDDQDAGKFTFQAQLYKNGDIFFVYKNIPIPASNISDANHPCKVGVSDAYLFNHKMKAAFEDGTAPQSKRVIHEYHRITVPFENVVTNAVVILKALPTCLQFTTCDSCANASLNYFSCSWCHPQGKDTGFCSDEDGLHRRRQEWVEGNCGKEKSKICSATTPKPSTDTTTTKPGKSHPVAVIPLVPIDSSDKPSNNVTSTNVTPTDAQSESGNGAMTFVIMFMFMLIIGVCWLYYAYTNPYSMSGQLLIKYRPSKFRSPSSQVRYSASVHM